MRNLWPVRMCPFAISGKVWSWGDGDYGKLGRGGSDSCKSPKLVEKFQNEHVVKALCGSQVSLVLTQEGNVWTWYVATILVWSVNQRKVIVLFFA